MSFEINLLRAAGPSPEPNTDSTHPGFDRQEDQGDGGGHDPAAMVYPGAASNAALRRLP